MAGNGTIGLELSEELPDVDAVLVPWGGGGLFSGIASALAALRPDSKVYAVEPETGAPLDGRARGGEPAGRVPAVVRRRRRGEGVLPAMWERAAAAARGRFTVSLDETAAAVRLLAERARVVAEGAGALPWRRRSPGQVPGGKLVCIVSGGNIDAARLATILAAGRRD